MRFFATAAAVVLISSSLPAPAAASLITLNDTFTATGFPSGAPLSTVTGSFSLTFDNSADVADTTGTVLTISVAGLSLAGTTPMFGYNQLSDTMTVGAYSGGNFNTSAGTNYIHLDINNVSTTPVLVNTQYSQVGATVNFSSRTGTLTPIETVPEPASLALLSTGVVVAGVLRRSSAFAKATADKSRRRQRSLT